MMKKFLYMILAVCLMNGCITNDLPYPVIVPNITSLEVEGAEKVDIDYQNRVVTLHMLENADLRAVSVLSVSLDSEIAKPSIGIVGIHDLTAPLKFDIRTYDDYSWTIQAVKDIDRYFTVKGQIGTSVIDVYNRRAIATVGKMVDISNIEVTSLKLGPEVSTYSLDPVQMKDFTHGLSVDVTAFDVTETWTLYVELTDLTIQIKDVNPWTYEAYVTSNGEAGKENGFEYREKGALDWITLDIADVTSDGGTFIAHIKNLKPATEYEVVAFSGESRTEEVVFKTDPATPIPNGSFEYASKVAGKDYYKFYDPDCGVDDGVYMFWGAGNGEGSEGVNGSANLGIVITYVDTEDKVDGNQSVRAQTSQMAGMLAAGNLFTGQFAGLVGTSGGKVNFGRPWSTRPHALKLYCKYSTDKMDIINGSPAGISLSKEDYDRAQIKFAIGTWDYRKYGGTSESPVHINTTDPSTFVDFSNDASTIANGDLIIHHDGYILNGEEKVSVATDQWLEYVIPLNYHSFDTKPTHIIISCAASQFGDFFTGSSSSTLWIDAMALIY